jgi:ribosomal protein S18 acetylase RimI-like enzyme
MPLSSEIVSAMQRLAVEQGRLLGARAPWHVGDLAWGTRQHPGREHEWRIRLWVEDGRTVAWSWLRESGLLDHDLDPEHQHLLDEILREPQANAACAFEDDAEGRRALARHGFTEPGGPTHFNVRDLETRPEPPPLPAGFTYRVASAADLAERVSIHRDVWEPSRVTETSYAAVRAQWPYRESLDCVIQAPDGRFAAYCLCWPDDANATGELEPVGVRPEFRRRGLGAAVCTYALRRWHDEGGRRAIVYCSSEPACALYRSIGFRRHATLIEYRRPAAGGALS